MSLSRNPSLSNCISSGPEPGIPSLFPREIRAVRLGVRAVFLLSFRRFRNGKLPQLRAARQARAMELSLISGVSARDPRITGFAAPRTMPAHRHLHR